MPFTRNNTPFRNSANIGDFHFIVARSEWFTTVLYSCADVTADPMISETTIHREDGTSSNYTRHESDL